MAPSLSLGEANEESHSHGRGRAGRPHFNPDYYVIPIFLIRKLWITPSIMLREAPKEIFPMRVPSPELASVGVEPSGI